MLKLFFLQNNDPLCIAEFPLQENQLKKTKN